MNRMRSKSELGDIIDKFRSDKVHPRHEKPYTRATARVLLILLTTRYSYAQPTAPLSWASSLQPLPATSRVIQTARVQDAHLGKS